MNIELVFALFLLQSFHFIGNSRGEVVYEPPIEDLCQQLCSNKALNLNDESTSECERGCRFFNIAMNTNSGEKTLDLNATKDQCCQSCSDAYPEDRKTNCFTGCCEMLQLQRDAWVFYLEQQGDNSILEVEVSLVSDPALWEQTLGSNTMYKIPQTMLRTMPLRPEISEVIDDKAWTPCTHNNEIPRWIVGLIAIVLTIITIYVSFILPSRTDNSLLVEATDLDNCTRHPENLLFQNGDLKVTVVYHGDEPCSKKESLKESPEAKLVTLNEFLTEDFHFNIPPPPKYTLLPVDDDRQI